MLSLEVVNVIKQRVAAGNSYSVIAKELGISRGSVRNVMRPDHWSNREEPPAVKMPEEHGRREWCHECGATVVMPCLACQLKMAKQSRRVLNRKLATQLVMAKI